MDLSQTTVKMKKSNRGTFINVLSTFSLLLSIGLMLHTVYEKRKLNSSCGCKKGTIA